MSNALPHQPWDAKDPDDEHKQPQILVYRVTNPSGSVSVTVHIDGRVHHVDLSPAVTRLTERHLADEIQVIADLARNQAQAGQHALITEFMKERGHDPVAIHGFLKRGLGLPTPEDVNDEKARVFATRYADRSEDRGDDWT